MHCHTPARDQRDYEDISISGLMCTENANEVDDKLHQEGCNVNALLMEIRKWNYSDSEPYRLYVPQM
jgi:hypothetical protein